MKQLFKNTTSLVGAFVFVVPFLFITVWFRFTDVSNSHFLAADPIYSLYHGFKVIYLFYFCWILYYSGHLIIQFIERRGTSFALGHLDHFLLSFFVGQAILQYVLLIIGYLSLYYFFTAILMTVAILVLSFPHLKEVALSAGQKIQSSSKPSARNYFNFILVAIAVLVGLVVLIQHGLFPSWDNDVLGHYKQYYNEVIRSHGVWPNKVWYHYYYTKGAGLMFLTILLTDVHGSQLVSFCFYVVSALTMFSLVRKVSNDTTWPLMATIFYMLMFIGNPPNFDNLQFVGNPTPFAKQHMISAVLTAALVWMVVMFMTSPTSVRKSWAYLMALVATNFILFMSTSFYFLLVFFGAFVIISLVTRNYQQAKLFFFLTSSVVAAMILNLVINYVTTGLAESTPFRVFLSFVDQEKFSQWANHYTVLYLLEGSPGNLGTYSTTSTNYVQWLARIFRLHNLRYFFPQPHITITLFSLSIGLALIKRVRPAYNVVAVIGPVLVMIGVGAVNSVINNQPISLERYYIFAVFLIVIISVTIWRLFFDLVINPPFRFVAACLLIVLVLTSATTDIYNETNLDLFKSQLKFAIGQSSFKEAYKAVGCYWDDAVEAKQTIGADTQVWTFLTWCGFGAVPGRDIEGDVSYTYKDWHIMAFADPDQAKEAFKKAGLNYFLLDVRGQNGAIPYSPLFAPGNIEKYFDIVTIKGDVLLLTWKGEAAHPLRWPRDFSEDWTFLTSSENTSGLWALYERVKYYYDKYEGQAYPVYIDTSLPPVKGFQ